MESNDRSGEKMMTFGQAVSVVFHKYGIFTGRASRDEYWWWFLFTFITSLPLGLLGTLASSWNGGTGAVGGFFSVVDLLWSLAILVPSLAVLARRVRDAGFSPYFLFLLLIPYAGAIAIFIFTLFPSKDLFRDSVSIAAATPNSEKQKVESSPSRTTTRTKAERARFCSRCGSPVEGHDFCTQCGAQVGR
jgi:uncharacterized membrane protein YhaH (DUF805 family)